MPPIGLPHRCQPEILEANERHRDAMHDQLLRLMRQHLTNRLAIPPNTKTQKYNASTITTYSGDPTFSVFENWLTALVVAYEAEQYGGEDRDRERLLHTLGYLSGEAQRWYQLHVFSQFRMTLDWSFESAILELYNRFVSPSSMEDAVQDFWNATYDPTKGVQGFYDTLMVHAQNMPEYPDRHQLVEAFLSGLPQEMATYVLSEGLNMTSSPVEDFVSTAKAYEEIVKNLDRVRRLTTR